MDILVALKQEQGRLQKQLTGIEGAIAAMNGSHPGPRQGAVPENGEVSAKRTMSAAARAKISKAAKARWAKYRAEKSKKAK